MRYRVQAAERPDGLYAVWEDTVFAAQRSTEDGTLLLIAPPGEAAPDGFDREWNGRAARVVLNGEVGATFSLQTHGRYDDEHFLVAPHTGGGELTLRWAGEDAARAAELGLTDFSTTAGPSQLTALWQTRHDFVESPDARPENGTGDQSAFLRAIGRTLLSVLPPGWQRVGAQFRQVGDYAELEIRSVGDEGNGPVSVSIAAPPQLGSLFARLRAAMYSPETGAWFQGTFTLDSASHFDFDFDADQEPTWRLAPNEGGKPSPRAYATELSIFPRDTAHVPAWLSAKAGLPLDVAFRHAKIADSHNEGERPVVNRPPVPPDQVRGVLDYLFRSPVAVSRPGPQPDIFTPNGPPDVPNAFHTDGVWIWPAAVPHYLRKYGVPPEPELIEHIRAAGFRPALVGELVRATAEAEISGKPRPPQTDADLPDETVRTRVERDGEPGRDARAGDVLDVLFQRLAEHGVAPTSYRIGANAVPEPGVWTLRRTENGWEVSRPPADEPVAFASLEEAARFFLGTLLLYPARAAVGANEEADNPADWPILPMRGEPPLNFFRRKRIVVLPAGTTVQRFGNDTGNLVHAEPARFVETSLAADREREHRLYRVQRPLRVITGITAPWNGTPGGAVAYVLPRPIAQHLESGALSRVQ